MKTAKRLVAFLIIFTMVGTLPYSIMGKSNAQVGNPSVSIQEQMFYRNHSAYNKAELNGLLPIKQTTFRPQKAVIENPVSNNEGYYPATFTGPMDSPWPMMSHDVYHTGRSPYNTTQPPEGVEIWRFGKSDSFDDGVIIDDKGIL